MNTHIKETWLEAYHDGELSNGRLRLVKKHLGQCSECQTRLDNLAALTTILQASPSAESQISSSRFVAQVGLRLKNRPNRPLWQRGLITAWRMIPVGLISTWAFAQTIFILTALILTFGRFGLGGELISNLVSLTDGNFGQAILLNVGLTAITGLFSLSWLASWWVSRSNAIEQNNLIKNR